MNGLKDLCLRSQVSLVFYSFSYLRHSSIMRRRMISILGRRWQYRYLWWWSWDVCWIIFQCIDIRDFDIEIVVLIIIWKFCNRPNHVIYFYPYLVTFPMLSHTFSSCNSYWSLTTTWLQYQCISFIEFHCADTNLCFRFACL